MRTTCAPLQAKLDALVALGVSGDREKFVRAFVPLDLGEDDLTGFVRAARQTSRNVCND